MRRRFRGHEIRCEISLLRSKHVRRRSPTTRLSLTSKLMAMRMPLHLHLKLISLSARETLTCDIILGFVVLSIEQAVQWNFLPSWLTSAALARHIPISHVSPWHSTEEEKKNEKFSDEVRKYFSSLEPRTTSLALQRNASGGCSKVYAMRTHQTCCCDWKSEAEKPFKDYF